MARRKTKKRKTSKKRMKSLRARRFRHEKREAKRLGLAHRVYVKQRNAKERAHHARLARMLDEQGADATIAHMFKIGQMY